MSSAVFREVQRFRQPWVWCVVGGTAAVSLWVFGQGLIQQLVLDKPWGDHPMSDAGLIVASILTLALTLGLTWLFLVLSLVVEVRSDALYVEFKPLKRRRVSYGDLSSVEPVVYRPIAHYGGWGVRRGRGGWAYNVSGNRGVRLEFHDGRHLLLGSQRPVELAAAIDRERGR